MKKLSIILITLLLCACKGNTYYCEKRDGNNYFLYTLKGINDRLIQVSFYFEHDFNQHISAKYLQDFGDLYDDIEIKDDSFSRSENIDITDSFSLLKTIEYLERDFYYCFK